MRQAAAPLSDLNWRLQARIQEALTALHDFHMPSHGKNVRRAGSLKDRALLAEVCRRKHLDAVVTRSDLQVTILDALVHGGCGLDRGLCETQQNGIRLYARRPPSLTRQLLLGLIIDDVTAVDVGLRWRLAQ